MIVDFVFFDEYFVTSLIENSVPCSTDIL